MYTKEQVNKNIRTEIIEVVINNAGTTEFNFGQLPNLRKAKRIIEIEFFSAAIFPKSPSGKTVVSDLCVKSSFVKLVDASGVELRSFPAGQVQKSLAALTIPQQQTQQIDPEKCIIKCADGAQIVANTSYIFAVKYEL